MKFSLSLLSLFFTTATFAAGTYELPVKVSGIHELSVSSCWRELRHRKHHLDELSGSLRINAGESVGVLRVAGRDFTVRVDHFLVNEERQCKRFCKKTHLRPELSIALDEPTSRAIGELALGGEAQRRTMTPIEYLHVEKEIALKAVYHDRTGIHRDLDYTLSGFTMHGSSTNGVRCSLLLLGLGHRSYYDQVHVKFDFGNEVTEL